MTELGPLEAADTYCRYLASRHYENFSVASLILPRDLRIHLARIYAFCRTTDDLGDESSDDGMQRLIAWGDQVVDLFETGREPVHPVLMALARTVASFNLSRQPFLDLIAANVQDQTVAAYDTWEELRAYCMLSAAPVGRLVLRVFQVDEPAAIPLSDDVCIGLQLANFAQDVKRDRAKGRTYLPQSDLRSHGVHEAVRRMCGRAEDLLMSGRELEDLVTGRLRFQLKLYRLGGLAIVDSIRKSDYRTDRSRPRVSRLAKVAVVGRALLEMGGRQGHAAKRLPA